MGAAPVELAEGSSCFHHVPPGPVNEVAARIVRRRRRPRSGRARRRPGDRRREGDRGGQGQPGGGAADDALGRRDDPDPPPARGRTRRSDGLVRPQVVLADPPLMVGLRRGAAARQRHERARPRRRLALHAAREPGLGDGRAARREADRPARSTPPAPSANPASSPSARSSAPTRSTRRCSASTTSSARPSSASCGSRTRRPTRRCCPRTLEMLSSRAGPQMTALARALGRQARRAGRSRDRARRRAAAPCRARRRPRRDRAGGEGDHGAPGAAADPRRPRGARDPRADRDGLVARVRESPAARE